MIRFGLLGSGRIGQVHAGTLRFLKGAQLLAVSDARDEAAAALAEETGAEVRETGAIVEATDIDAVVICTPTDTHADLIEQAAQAGKPIFCEKPVDLDADRVRSCLATVEKTGVPLMIGFQRRFDPDFRALKDAIDTGRIGEVEQIMITSRDPSPPPVSYIERSGGLFRDMMIHDFDMARFLLGEPVRRVLAVGACRVDPGIGAAGDVDTATVILETDRGTQVVISNSRRAVYGYDQRVEVLGSAGMLQVGNQSATNIRTATDEGFCDPVLLDFFMMRYREAYAAEMKAFLETIRKGTEVPVTGQDGLKALEIADAATVSANEGRWANL